MNAKPPLIALGLVAVWLSWAAASAQATPTTATPPAAEQTAPADGAAAIDERARQEASKHFRRGVELFQEAAYRAALVEFQRAYQILPDHRLHYNLGQTKLQLQDYLGATQSYEVYLLEGGAAVKAARRQEVERQLELLRGRVARLAIETSRDGVKVFVDDQLVGRSPMAETVPVNVGRHRVVARADDGAQATKVVDVAGGDLLELRLEVAKVVVQAAVAGAQDDLWSTMKRMSVVSMIGGGVMIGGAAAAAVISGGAQDDFDSAVSGGDIDAAMGHRDRAGAAALATDVLGFTGIALATTGVVLWFVDKAKHKAGKSSDTALLNWGIGPTSIVVRGVF